MNYIKFQTFRISILITLLIVTIPLSSQISLNNQIIPQVSGWFDNTHYLIQTSDQNGNQTLQKIDIRSGKGVDFKPEKDKIELLKEKLPSAYRITAVDLISPDESSVVFVRDSDLFYFSATTGNVRQLTKNSSPEMNMGFSPDSKKIAYTRDKDLYVFDLVSFREQRVTYDASETVYNGWSSWVYMEEILGRPSAYRAFWWSPDGSRIAWLRTDEADVPLFYLNHLDEAAGVHGLLEVTHYPKPGDPNPKVKMGIAEIATLKTTWVKTDYNTDQYIAWPFWSPDSKSLAIQVLNRDQNDMKYILADAGTGEYKIIYNETSKTWVEFSEDIYVMKNGSGFILRSYLSGWENLYYYGWDGTLISKITDVPWRVTGIESVNEEKGLVYFTGTGTESTDKHYYRVRLDGKEMIQITKRPGTHDLLISPEGNYFIDTWNSITDPGGIEALDKNGNFLREIYKVNLPDNDPAKNPKAELVRIPTSDGLFNMPALIKFPLNFDPNKKYPVVFTVYGGPNSGSVTNSWNSAYPDWYAMNGIITISVDHRGSGHFGMKGQEYLYRNLGKWEILDYEDAVKWMRTKPYTDASKVGITGGSYGGYITCLALTKGSGYWQYGVADYSVTDWKLYDNIYTERYMDKPAENVAGYAESSVLGYINGYTGNILITHGDVDNNVHLQHSIQLISKLEDAGKSFEFMLYPEGRHGWGGAKRIHLTKEAHDFWLKSFFGSI